jgi:hypothetical protein
MCGRALLWVGVDLLGGRSIAVHKDVPMYSFMHGRHSEIIS